MGGPPQPPSLLSLSEQPSHGVRRELRFEHEGVGVKEIKHTIKEDIGCPACVRSSCKQVIRLWFVADVQDVWEQENGKG